MMKTRLLSKSSLIVDLRVVLAFALGLTLFATVVGAERPRLAVIPNPALVEPGGRVQFSCTAPRGATIAWSVLPADLGSITPAGLFTSSSKEGKGVVRVLAERGGEKLVGFALVRVAGNQAERVTLRVDPSGAVLAPGQSQAFRCVIARPQTGGATSGVEWRVIPETIGSISPDGIFTAGQGSRTGKVVAILKDEPGQPFAAANITIRPEGQSQISVALRPRFVRLRPGQSQQFSYELPEEIKAAGERSVRYWVEPKGLGTITGSGVFVAGEKEGTGYVGVEVRSGDKSGLARSPVFVESSSGVSSQHIRIAPRRVWLHPGETRRFEIAITDAEGKAVTGSFRLRVVPERLGTATPDGLFMAGQQPLEGRLIAQLPSGETDIAQISIRQEKQLQIRISPAKMILKPNASPVQYRATIQDPQGNIISLPVTWRVVPEGLGMITPDGFFTPSGRRGIGAVLAQIPPEVGQGKARAYLAIVNYRVSISGPDPREIEEGASTYFHAQVTEEAGKTLDLPLEWRVEPASLGQIDPTTGLFQAGIVPATSKRAEGRVIAVLPADQGGGLAQVRVVVDRRNQ